MSNLFELPFLASSIADPQRADRLANRIVDRLASLNEDGDDRGYLKAVRFFGRMVRAALDPARIEASRDLVFVQDVLERATSRGFYAPAFAYSFSRKSALSQIIRRVHVQDLVEAHFGNAEGSDQWAIIELCGEYHSIMSCDHCGELFADQDLQRRYGGGWVCSGCRDHSVQYSERYDAWVHEDCVRNALDEDGERCVIDEDDGEFHYDEELDRYIHHDYEPPARSIIKPYHHSKPFFSVRGDAWVAEHGRALGVELEVEGYSVDPATAARTIHDHVNGGEFGRHVFFERDGSLSNGFELISQPMSVPALRETFQFLREPFLVRGLRSHRTSTCGLHVHVSRAGLSNLTIARAVTFVNDSGNDAFIQALARRYNTGFCNITEKDLETAHLPGDRYEAINLTGRETIEFRLFRGSLKFEAVIAAVEFCHALLEYCARPETAAGGLNAQAFVRWCASDLADETAILRAYVNDRMAGLFQHSEAA